jgi:hypothetical protein
LFQIYFTIVIFLTISRRHGHVEDGSLRWLPMEVCRRPFDPFIYHGRLVNARLTLIGRARRSIRRIRRASGLGGRPALQTTLVTWNVSLESYHPYLLPQEVSKTPITLGTYNSLPKIRKGRFGSLSPLVVKLLSYSKLFSFLCHVWK